MTEFILGACDAERMTLSRAGWEDRVERGADAGVPVMQHEPDPDAGVFEIQQEVPGLLRHLGLDRVLRGSENPPDSRRGERLDTGQARNSNDKPMSSRLMRGIPRGSIRPWDGWLVSIRVELGQVSCASSAFVLYTRSPVPGRRAVRRRTAHRAIRLAPAVGDRGH
jgi:hypothetical protein